MQLISFSLMHERFTFISIPLPRLLIKKKGIRKAFKIKIKSKNYPCMKTCVVSGRITVKVERTFLTFVVCFNMLYSQSERHLNDKVLQLVCEGKIGRVFHGYRCAGIFPLRFPINRFDLLALKLCVWDMIFCLRRHLFFMTPSSFCH